MCENSITVETDTGEIFLSASGDDVVDAVLVVENIEGGAIEVASSEFSAEMVVGGGVGVEVSAEGAIEFDVSNDLDRDNSIRLCVVLVFCCLLFWCFCLLLKMLFVIHIYIERERGRDSQTYTQIYLHSQPSSHTHTHIHKYTPTNTHTHTHIHTQITSILRIRFSRNSVKRNHTRNKRTH